MKNMTLKSMSPLKKTKVWQIGPKDIPSYICMDDKMTDPSEYPAELRTKAMNRYLDILPTPRTRVKLKELEGDPTSHYINANYVG